MSFGQTTYGGSPYGGGSAIFQAQDGFAVSDAAVSAAGTLRGTSDGWLIQDSAKDPSAAYDSWALADSPAFIRGIQCAASDSLSLAEWAGRVARASRPTNDSFVVGDGAVSRFAGYRVGVDSWAVSDLPLVTKALHCSASDSFSLNDAVVAYWAPWIDLPTFLALDPDRRPLSVREGCALVIGPLPATLALQSAPSAVAIKSEPRGLALKDDPVGVLVDG